MTALTELIYTSQSQKDFTAAELNALIEHARTNNVNWDITGMLCYDGRTFLQVIEGPKPKIESLFKVLNHDPRHDKIDLIYSGNIEHRQFSQWTMAFKTVPEDLQSQLKDRLSVMSFDEHKYKTKQPNSSFGARLFSLFINDIYSETS